MRVRAAWFAGSLAASLLTAAAARGGTPRALPELSLLVLPSAPGSSDLALVTPTSEGADLRSRALRIDHTGLVGLGVGACGLWALGVTAKASPRAQHTPGTIGFALASAGAAGVLASRLFPGDAGPVAGVRVLLVIGQGGGGLAVAARF